MHVLQASESTVQASMSSSAVCMHALGSRYYNPKSGPATALGFWD